MPSPKEWISTDRTHVNPNTHTATSDRVVEDLERRFRQSTYCPIRNLKCDFHEGVLTIRGRLPSYYLKQVAQTIARNVDGVEEVVNRVEVETKPR